MKKFDKNKVTSAIQTLLEGLGIDWKYDENFRETPDRVMRAYKEMNIGLYEEFNNVKTFPSIYKGIVYFKTIEAIGLCPHHLLPISYDISFAYIPDCYVLGLSKVPRIIKHFASRPVLQEDLTHDIVDYFNTLLFPKGIAIVVKGVHGCMKYRGIKEAEEVKTAELKGVFMDEPETREEFYQLIKS